MEDYQDWQTIGEYLYHQRCLDKAWAICSLDFISPEFLKAVLEKYNRNEPKKQSQWKTLPIEDLRKDLDIHHYKWQQFRTDKEARDLIDMLLLIAFLWEREKDTLINVSGTPKSYVPRILPTVR